MVKRVGVVGLSEGNGHPYSFSAIINGYDPRAMQASGWVGIFDYLDKKDPSEFGVADLRVTDVWTQSTEESQKIAAAANIEHVCQTLDEMVERVDAVIIARDDWRFHLDMARPFLEKGKPVFIDKPLTLDMEELKILVPYIHQGKLMSCAGLRYARELDEYRQLCRRQPPKFISASIVCDWEKYGVHLLDGIFSGLDKPVESVYSTGSTVRSTILRCEDGMLINLNCVGSTAKTFSFNVFGEDYRHNVEVDDNFSAFKRTLYHFRDMVIEGRPPIDADLTVKIMKILVAANRSAEQKREVPLHEISI